MLLDETPANSYPIYTLLHFRVESFNVPCLQRIHSLALRACNVPAQKGVNGEASGTRFVYYLQASGPYAMLTTCYETPIELLPGSSTCHLFVLRCCPFSRSSSSGRFW